MAEEVPRLSGTLRVFANVFESYSTSFDQKLIEIKKRKRLNGNNSQKDWSSLSSSIIAKCNQSDIAKVSYFLLYCHFTIFYFR